jgi:hypothetical protein
MLKGGLGDLLREAAQQHETNTLAMVQVVKKIRKDIFDIPEYTFDGTFAAYCQSASIPRSLLNLVSLLLNGTSIQDQDAEESHSCLSI